VIETANASVRSLIVLSSKIAPWATVDSSPLMRSASALFNDSVRSLTVLSRAVVRCATTVSSDARFWVAPSITWVRRPCSLLKRSSRPGTASVTLACALCTCSAASLERATSNSVSWMPRSASFLSIEFEALEMSRAICAPTPFKDSLTRALLLASASRSVASSLIKPLTRISFSP